MTWTKLPDDFAEDCAQLSDAAFRTHVEGLLWSMRRLNGGTLTPKEARRALETEDTQRALDELVAAGFWTSSSTGWRIEHTMDLQVEPEVEERRKTMNAARQRRYRRKAAGLPDEENVTRDTTRDKEQDEPPDADVTGHVTRNTTRDPGLVWTGLEETTSFPERQSFNTSNRARRSKLRSDARDVPTGEIRNLVEKGARVQDRAARLVADVLDKTTDDLRQILEYGDDEEGDKLLGFIEETLVPALVGGLSDKDAKTELRRARDADHDITWATFDQPAHDWRDGA